VDDAGPLMYAIASLDQGIDPVIVKFGPAADHVNDMDISSVKMNSSAPFRLRAFALGADQLDPKGSLCRFRDAHITVNEKGAQAAIGVPGFG
jgi:hypothetical protein